MSVWVVLALNVMVFLAVLVNRSFIISRFGLQPESFFQQPWTIVTNLFVHYDFYHIIFNMLTFYFFGVSLLRLVGEKRFLVVYFGGGVLGNLFFIGLTLLGQASSIGFLGSPYVTTVGASGAIFALGGALAVMIPQQTVIVFPIPIPIRLWIAVIGGFFLLFFLPGIAWQAHLGGLVFGLLAGYFFKRRGRYYYR